MFGKNLRFVYTIFLYFLVWLLEIPSIIEHNLKSNARRFITILFTRTDFCEICGLKSICLYAKLTDLVRDLSISFDPSILI